jgi:leader peptidase (prepilin peptidase)/N-methyltransferase
MLQLLSPGLVAYILGLTALLGLVMGSFLHCWAYRFAREQSAIKGRSRCPVCGKALSPLELIPVFSYFYQKGRCRGCGAGLSLRYPVAELLCGAYFMSVVWRFDVSPEALQYLIAGSLLFCIAWVDWDVRWIPDRLLAGVILNFVLFAVILGGDPAKNLLTGLLGGLSVSLPLFILVLIMDRLLGRASMGGGDIKLFFAIGLYFSWQANLLLILTACILGILLSPILRKKSSDDRDPEAFPFGPAIITAYWFVLLWSGPLLNWYRSFL